MICRLTPREKETLQHLACGYSLYQTAVSMGITTRTVATNITRSRTRLQARNLVHAVAIAVALHLVEAPVLPEELQAVESAQKS